MTTTTREEMTATQRILHLKLLIEAHEWRQERVNKSVHRNPQAKHYAKLVWDAGVLNRTALSRLLGVSRQTVYDWFPTQKDEPKRLRGPKDFGALRYLLQALEAREQGEKLKWGQITGDLKGSGVPPSLIRFLCGPGKVPIGASRTLAPRKTKKEEPAHEEVKPAPTPSTPEESPRDADDLQPEVRSDDEGHPEQGEDFVINLYKDPVDHGRGHSEEVTEPDHIGDVLGAAARDSDTDTESDEGESGVADNGLLDPAKLTDAEYIEALENGTTWVQEGRQPFGVEPIDFEGDRYLEDLPLPPPSGKLAAQFQEWEQAEES